MSDSVLKDLPASERIERTVKCCVCGWHTPGVPQKELWALREEIARLTLLSGSQLANQERLTEELARVEANSSKRLEWWADATMELRDVRAELATERANQERLVGEMQEMRRLLKKYRNAAHGFVGSEELRSKADALLAPKDTPTEPKSAPEEQK